MSIRNHKLYGYSMGTDLNYMLVEHHIEQMHKCLANKNNYGAEEYAKNAAHFIFVANPQLRG